MHVTLTSLVELNNIGAPRTDTGSAEAPFAAILDSAERHEADRTATSHEPSPEATTEEVRQPDDVQERENAPETEERTSEERERETEPEQGRESDVEEDREAPRDERELEQEPESESEGKPAVIPGRAEPETATSRTDLGKTIATAVAEDTITEFAKNQTNQNASGESLLNQAKLAQAGATQAPTAEVAAAPDGQQAATATGEATQQIKGTTAAKAAGAPSFVDPRTVHITETARASIFKQIAVRITGETGEMRVRLDPPELGHLDLQMFVDKSGAMRLNVIAERADIAQAIERHLAELRATLAEHGVTVTEASIHSGTSGNQGHFEGGGHAAGADHGDHDDAPIAARDVQFIKGDGLDLLV